MEPKSHLLYIVNFMGKINNEQRARGGSRVCLEGVNTCIYDRYKWYRYFIDRR